MNLVNLSNELVWIVPFQQLLTYIPAKDVKNIFVSSYDVKDPDSPAPNKHGYQRNPDEKRFKAIGNYFAENKSRITPILISVRVKSDSDIKEFLELLSKREFAQMKKRFSAAVMSNVDGQHRAGGLNYAAKNIEGFGDARVPLCLFFGMTYEEEAREFNTVNSTQRKLPKALIETTKGDITERADLSHSQQIRQIAFGISRDKDSPWYDQINMTGGRALGQKVTYEGIRRSTANMFPAEVIGRLNVAGLDPLNDIAKPFWLKIAETFPNAWNGASRTVADPDTGEMHEEIVPYRLKELVGVASLARLGRDIIASVLDANQEFHVPLDQALATKMAPLSHVDWEKRPDNSYMASQAGFAGQSQLYAILYKLVYEKQDPDGNPIV